MAFGFSHLFYSKFHCDYCTFFKAIIREMIAGQNEIITWPLPINLSSFHWVRNAGSQGNWNRLMPLLFVLEPPAATQRLTISIVWTSLNLHGHSYIANHALLYVLNLWRVIMQYRKPEETAIVQNVHFSMLYFIAFLFEKILILFWYYDWLFSAFLN